MIALQVVINDACFGFRHVPSSLSLAWTAFFPASPVCLDAVRRPRVCIGQLNMTLRPHVVTLVVSCVVRCAVAFLQLPVECVLMQVVSAAEEPDAPVNDVSTCDRQAVTIGRRQPTLRLVAALQFVLNDD